VYFIMQLKSENISLLCLQERTSLKSVLILVVSSSHCLGLPVCVCRFPDYDFVVISLNSVMRATCTVHFILVALSTFIMFDENYSFLIERRSSVINILLCIPAFTSWICYRLV